MGPGFHDLGLGAARQGIAHRSSHGRTRAGTVQGVRATGESGLTGIAFHPDFPRQPFVYAIHTYEDRDMLRNRLVRLRWDGRTLGPQETLFDGMQGGWIHDGARVAVGRDRL